MFWDTVISLVVVALVVLVFWYMPDDDEWGEEAATDAPPSDGEGSPVLTQSCLDDCGEHRNPTDQDEDFLLPPRFRSFGSGVKIDQLWGRHTGQRTLVD